VTAALMTLLGLLVATAVRVPTAVLCLLAFGMAALRGLVNTGGVGPETNRTLFAAGLTVTAYAAITLIMAATVGFRGPVDSGTAAGAGAASAGWRRIAIRVCGSWIAAIGLMIGAFALLPQKYAQAEHPPGSVHTSADTRLPGAS